MLPLNSMEKIQAAPTSIPMYPKGAFLVLFPMCYKHLTYQHPGKLRRWADKFCLHCNIFIYFRHIWIKPVLCSRVVSLSSIILQLEHTDTYSPHQVHIEMEEFSDVQFKQRAVIEFLNAGKSSSNCNSQTNASRL